jgi:hypothetical protein
MTCTRVRGGVAPSVGSSKPALEAAPGCDKGGVGVGVRNVPGLLSGDVLIIVPLHDFTVQPFQKNDSCREVIAPLTP